MILIEMVEDYLWENTEGKVDSLHLPHFPPSARSAVYAVWSDTVCRQTLLQVGPSLTLLQNGLQAKQVTRTERPLWEEQGQPTPRLSFPPEHIRHESHQGREPLPRVGWAFPKHLSPTDGGTTSYFHDPLEKVIVA